MAIHSHHRVKVHRLNENKREIEYEGRILGENKGITYFSKKISLIEARKVEQIKLSFFISLLKWGKRRR